MAAYTTIEDWTDVDGEYVLSVTIRKTDNEKYPSGWDYSFHLGELGGPTILRYDNAHERTKGHERHTTDGVEEIEFPGMLALYERFEREAEEMTPITWNWSRTV